MADPQQAPAPAPEPDDPATVADLRALTKHLRSESAGHKSARTIAEQAAADALKSAETARAEAEAKIAEARQAADKRILMAELRAAAVAAGIVDADGVKLLDTSKLTLAEDGSVAGAAELIEAARTAKPWLFTSPGAPRTGNPTPPPRPNEAPKHARDMTADEWRAARVALLSRR